MLASFSLNPVESVLFLILCFYLSACILFIFNVEFLALTYVVVYVGAVAVLFLFVIMMLDIRVKQNFFNQYKNILYIIFSLFIYVFILLLFSLFDKVFFFEKTVSESSLLSIDNFSNIELFGQVLFNYYPISFLIAGLILLVALVGCIYITNNYNKKKEFNQLIK
jgi:NADH-quinone oxidoreductase subunit J